MLSILALQQNLWLLNGNDVPTANSILQLSAPETQFIVDYFIRNMYGTQQQLQDHTMYNNMNSNMMEASLIPGSTGMSSSPTTMLQQPNDLYSNGNGGNMISSLRTHSSKFPVSKPINIYYTKDAIYNVFDFNVEAYKRMNNLS